jgi:DNA invertase Pin-like site-specific DNA recombinase
VSTATKSRRGEVIAFEQDPAVQEQPLRLLIAQRGWTLYRVYSERLSGAEEARPGLNALMVDTRRGAFDAVVVWRFDRFARSVKQLVLALEEFRSLGIDFISHQEALDTSNPMGRAMFTIIAAMAELERDVIRERTAAGLEYARSMARNPENPSAAREPYSLVIKCSNCTAKVYPDGKSLAGWASVRGRYAES